MAKKSHSNGNILLQSPYIGLAAIVIALISLTDLKTSLALVAIALGSFSIWRAFHVNEYQFLFLGVAALLIALLTIYNFTIQFLLVPA